MTTKGPRLTYVNPDREIGVFSTSATPPSVVYRSTSPWQNFEAVTDSSPHKYLSGGSFNCTKAITTEQPCYVDITVNASPGTRSYSGLVYAGNAPTLGTFGPSGFYNTSNNWPQLYIGESDASLNTAGVKAWRKFKPTSRNGSLGQAILELKDLPSMLEQSNIAKQLMSRHKGFLHQSAGQYLNYQFGWVPFLSDVRDFVKNSVNAQRRINQLARDNGKTVRRGGTISSAVNTITYQSWNYPESGMDAYFYRSTPSMKDTLTVGNRFWFAGAFRYYIQKPTAGALGDFLLQTHVNAILYGDDLSPSLLWQITPWSWLVDWWSSAGDAFANYFEDSEDNLVGAYAYVMANSYQRMSRVCSMALNDGKNYECSTTWNYECKQRMPASPYGFYLNPPDLSAKQVAILTALGLTKRIRGYS